MPLPTYRIKIDGKYLKGYDDTKSSGKSGHMGWQPRAIEMPVMVVTKNEQEARLVEGNICLKSEIDRIYERLRYDGLSFSSMEILKV